MSDEERKRLESSMTPVPTPRTDAIVSRYLAEPAGDDDGPECSDWHGSGSGGTDAPPLDRTAAWVLLVVLARQLERELTQAAERIDQLERLLQEWVDDFSCECKNSTCTMCKSRAALSDIGAKP